MSTPRKAGLATSGKAAQRAMAEKTMARYIPLECGHHTPCETELLYRVFGDGTQVMCERCGNFRNPKVSQVVADYPDEPMF